MTYIKRVNAGVDMLCEAMQRVTPKEQGMKHTPGPWGVMNDGPAGDGKPWKAHLEAAPGLTLASPHNTEPICRVSGYCQPIKENASLIAAAPELLSVAARIQEMDADRRINGGLSYAQWDVLVANAEAAIAKAEGREP